MSDSQEVLNNINICDQYSKEIAKKIIDLGYNIHIEKCSFKIIIGPRIMNEFIYDTLSIAVAPNKEGNRSKDHNDKKNFKPKYIQGLLMNKDKIIDNSKYPILYFEDINSIVSEIIRLNDMLILF